MQSQTKPKDRGTIHERNKNEPTINKRHGFNFILSLSSKSSRL